ncbi:MAG: hypothetical protein PUB45_05145 [Bacteroidales bacterium]|nr:hypothetical protein [Bacteroidales bacterium]MDY3782963.1 hypothetical protein [Candidatus Cryptobacteroides sp.]
MEKQSISPEAAAAIALAIGLYLEDEVHDTESGVITIRRNSSSQWNSPAFSFRRKPSK